MASEYFLAVTWVDHKEGKGEEETRMKVGTGKRTKA